MREMLEKVLDGGFLSISEAYSLMMDIMDGKVPPSVFGAIMGCMRMRGEREEEIVGFAQAMLDRCIKLELPFELLDTCGTGGDGSGSFNISTASGIIASACGIKVAKHGNRAISSRSGSADVLEALGAKIELSPESVKRCIEEVGFGFIFAPIFHPSMKRVAPLRKELGTRTVFNILGPLTNPARASFQVLGVFKREIMGKMARALKMLGTKKAWVLHSEDGLDEISPGARTFVLEVDDEGIKELTIEPSEYGFPVRGKESIRGGDREENAKTLLKLLSGERGPVRDACLLNAGASVFIAGKARDLKEGIEMASEAIDSGRAKRVLDEFIKLSRGLE